MVEPIGWRKPFYKLVHNPMFDKFITLVVVFNTIALMVKYYQMNSYVKETLELLNYLFAFIFNLEMIFKLISDERKYFMNNWNLLDMFIVISADVGLVMSYF